MPWADKITPINKYKKLNQMCGAYRLQTAAEAVRGFFPKGWEWNGSSGIEPSGRIGPSAKKPGSASNHRLVVRQNGARNEFVSLRWRFESKWMRDEGVKVPINARSETMFTDGLFKFSARERRCLVVVDGFYEPKGPKDGKREQYLFTFPEQRPFALGGIWTKFKNDDDEFEGFAICTTTPNDQVGVIHGRMPIILDTYEEWESWLGGDQNDVVRLCEAIERPELSSQRISNTS